ncbi:MAG: flagellar motor switch protein FliM [Bryobacteraceae bacterium]|nr:flagellar motor switch protein FliM [Bryobacteraceae bacterium]
MMEGNSHALSQEDIDALFQSQSGAATPASRMALAQKYDFRRSDRIPKEQIRALRGVHDTFSRSLASSLSAYLRTYVNVNLISVEQLSFRELMACLPSPTCLSVLRITPFDGIGILEMNPALAFPMIENLLGGGKIKPLIIQREMTLIEQQILNTLLALILQNLSLSWQSVAAVDFVIESNETEPGLLHVLPPNEAVVSIATEIQIGDTSGMMNIGIPSSIVKQLRHNFDQQWTARRSSATEDEIERTLALVSGASVDLEARVEGSVVRFDDLLDLAEGDILQFDQRTTEPVSLLVNQLPKWRGQIQISGGRKAVGISAEL